MDRDGRAKARIEITAVSKIVVDTLSVNGCVVTSGKTVQKGKGMGVLGIPRWWEHKVIGRGVPDVL
jgi:hypothetical protein